MTQLLINGIDERTIHKLEARAHRHGQSLESEVKYALSMLTEQDDASPYEAVEQLHAALAGRTFVDSAEEIRADRDR